MIIENGNGLMPNNRMYVRSNTGGDTNSWKMIFGDETRKVNPLFDVNVSRNNLILESIQSNDWSKYNEFEAKQHPAWYEEVDEKQVPNKIYYGNLIESKLKALQEAKMSGDQSVVKSWENNLQEAIKDFKNAPGIVPYVIGLNSNADLAATYGVEEPDGSYFNSPYNSALVNSQGKFEDNMWYDNPIFKEDTELKTHVENLVEGTFPTSKDPKEPAKPTVNTTDTDTDTSSFDIQAAFLRKLTNIQQAIKPNIQDVMDKYKYA
ncbi:hypothetical protein [Heyndrickxia oleronia]|uniref:hypothetical protein n=1 Tax=Heyndrickxia oleronia TaxID=38875 RepID=UPI0021B4CE47|nr:hypothetical protein [Heyndrickxia oleronia]